MKKILALLIVLLASPSCLYAEAAIMMATADDAPLSKLDGTGFHDQVVREAFRRIGLDMQIVHLTAERALINANEGIEDGIYVRIMGLESVYENLRVVPEKITEYEFIAFGKKSDPGLKDWADLKEYEVGIVTGWKILENNVVHHKSLTKFKNPQLMFKALMEDKVDVVVFNRMDGYGILKELGLHGIQTVGSPFATRAMYMYVHKTGEQRIPQLTTALLAMKVDGTYERIKAATLASYYPDE